MDSKELCAVCILSSLFNWKHSQFPSLSVCVCVCKREGKTDVWDSLAFEGIVSILIIDAWFPIRCHQAENPSSHSFSFSSARKRKNIFNTGEQEQHKETQKQISRVKEDGASERDEDTEGTEITG